MCKWGPIMSDIPNPFEAMLKAGADWAKSFDPSKLAMNADTLNAMMGKTFNPNGLDAKTRLLLTLMGLTVQGATAEAQIDLTIRNAIAAGATQQEIAETIAQAAMFGGVPAMTKAMEIATTVFNSSQEPSA